MLNYYHKFMPNFSTLLAPLHELLHKEVQWNWERSQKLAFEETKRQLQSTDVLVHYDPKKPLLLNCDASPCGVGAVLSHCMLDGHEKPIAFASRTLCTAENNYAQIESDNVRYNQLSQMALWSRIHDLH